MASFVVSIALFVLTVESNNPKYPNRPTFHFVPVPIGHMNDPNGPFYDAKTEKYHLFFQYYSPRKWGHAISDDLLRWINLPIAITNNETYNKGGVWSGSTTQLTGSYTADHQKYIMYSVNTNNLICLAYPADPNDVNLTYWTNYPENCILNMTRDNVPGGRDPATSWTTDGGKTWTFIYTAEQTFQTTDWKHWSKGPGRLFGPLSGIECPDFYELPKSQQFEGATHVVKVSWQSEDWWSFGRYNETETQFIPYNKDTLFCNDCIFDHGLSWYAAKSFYDIKNDRQVIFGWFREQEGVNNNGWNGAQSLPRTITLLNAQQSPTGYPRIISYPIKEFNNLRIQSTKFIQTNVSMVNGQNIMFDTSKIAGNELDIELIWNKGIDCGIFVNGNGSALDGLGTTYTQIGINFDVSPLNAFYIAPNGEDPTIQSIPGWNGTTAIKIRIIIDHSIVTIFINDGIVSGTRRVYQNLTTYSVGLYSNSGNCELQSFIAYNVTAVIQPPPQ